MIGVYESEERKNLFTFLSYFVSIIVIVISVFITLVFKNELERMFADKKSVMPFHICNLLIILIVSMAAYSVMTIYIFGHELNFIRQVVIFLFIILPIYLFGNFAFEKYKSIHRKYMTSENRKVIVLNEKYLKEKKRFSKLRKYNSFFEKK